MDECPSGSSALPVSLLANDEVPSNLWLLCTRPKFGVVLALAKEYAEKKNKLFNINFQMLTVKKKQCYGVHVTWSLVLCVCFVDRCLCFCTFSFVHCVVCSSLSYGFWNTPSNSFIKTIQLLICLCNSLIEMIRFTMLSKLGIKTLLPWWDRKC